jgi:hypothetical protein
MAKGANLLRGMAGQARPVYRSTSAYPTAPIAPRAHAELRGLWDFDHRDHVAHGRRGATKFEQDPIFEAFGRGL